MTDNRHIAESYDAVPYSHTLFRETHPRRLATLGVLFGLNCPPVEACRVLELGCASGGNLLPMAYGLPGAKFVGIDLSPRQIADGNALAERAGLGNVELLAMDIMNLTPAMGRFDFIICHGVYSWVPPAVQEKILRACGELLTDHGVTMISFNTLPGGYGRRAVREMMLFHTQPNPAQRIANSRQLLAMLGHSPLTAETPGAPTLRTLAAMLPHKADSYLVHEYLEDFNEPLYLHEFSRRAAGAGLQYLGDALTNSTALERTDAALAKLLDEAAGDVVRQQQYCDFIRWTTFRRALLCRGGVKLNHAGDAQRVRALAAASRLAPKMEGGRECFVDPAGTCVMSEIPLVNAALRHLAGVFPQAVPFEDLCYAARPAAMDDAAFTAQCDELAGELLEDYKLDLVELYASPPRFAATSAAAGERPQVSCLARSIAQVQPRVPTLRHEVVEFDETLRRAVTWIDGTRTREQIAEAMVADGFGDAGASRKNRRLAVERELETLLAQLAKKALLCS